MSLEDLDIGEADHADGDRGVGEGAGASGSVVELECRSHHQADGRSVEARQGHAVDGKLAE